MKQVPEFKVRFRNLVNETKILTSKVNADKSHRFKYFEILSNQYIITYSYLNELEEKEQQEYLKKLETIRDIIVKYGLDR